MPMAERIWPAQASTNSVLVMAADQSLSGSLKSYGWELYKTRKGKAGGVVCRYPSPDWIFIIDKLSVCVKRKC
jgi:hypothetical protein